MDIIFECTAKGCSPKQWKGNLQLIHLGEIYEANITARGSFFQVIIGKHESGNFICIPNWHIDSELASLNGTL